MTEFLFFTCEEIDLNPRVYCKFDMSYIMLLWCSCISSPFEGSPRASAAEYVLGGMFMNIADVYLKEVLQHLQKKRKSDKKLSDFFINQPKL